MKFHLFKKKSAHETPAYSYDPERERPVIRASICNGEQVAGFREREGSAFHEVMLIRDSADLNRFMEMYGLKHVDKEY